MEPKYIIIPIFIRVEGTIMTATINAYVTIQIIIGHRLTVIGFPMGKKQVNRSLNNSLQSRVIICLLYWY